VALHVNGGRDYFGELTSHVIKENECATVADVLPWLDKRSAG
jgi:hypothetical protein